MAAPASADPGSPFYTGTASCSDYEAEVYAPAVTSAFPGGVARVQASDDLSGSDNDAPIGPGDIEWVPVQYVDVGGSPTVGMDCSTGSITASFYTVPSAPISYSGATTYEGGGTNSELPFSAPATDYYEADITVTQGAVSVDCTTGRLTVTPSGVCDLGSINAGSQASVDVDAVDGPQAIWTVTIRALPVALSAVKASPSSGFTGSPTTISYTVSGDTTVTAGVYNSSDQLIQSLASGLAVSQGNHSLTWGGTGTGGELLPAGAYTVDLTSTDSQGNVSTQSVPFTINPVTVSSASVSTSSAYVGGAETIHYSLNGAAKVTATIKNSSGAVVARPLSSTSEGKGNHSLKWNEIGANGQPVPAGAYNVTISATDGGGDVTTASAARSLKAYEMRNGISSAAQVKPSLINLSGQSVRAYLGGKGKKATLNHPSQKALGRLDWTIWNTQAAATGVLWYDASGARKLSAGSYRAYPVKVHLFDPKSGVFRDLTITFTGARPSGVKKTLTL